MFRSLEFVFLTIPNLAFWDKKQRARNGLELEPEGTLNAH